MGIGLYIYLRYNQTMTGTTRPGQFACSMKAATAAIHRTIEECRMRIDIIDIATAHARRLAFFS